MLMGLFDDMLKAEETLFRNDDALDFEFVPKVVPFREGEQREVVNSVKPLLLSHTGRNIIIHGPPGVGKTVAVKHVLKELEESDWDINLFYINCWKKNTTYKVMLELCEQLDFKFTQNKKIDELLRVVKGLLTGRGAVLVFDEIDKAEDYDFLYLLTEELYHKSIILITNHKEWIATIDDRIRSRLMPGVIEFKPYTLEEVRGILKERVKLAFQEGVWEDSLVEEVCRITHKFNDVRLGLFLLREAAMGAELESSPRIKRAHLDKAISRINSFMVKADSQLGDQSKEVLDIIKENPNKKIGDIFLVYKEKGGSMSYRSFQRKIKSLSDNGFIETKRIGGGKEGNTTILSFTKGKKA